MVVAGAQVHVVAQAPALAARHQQHLGVGLVPHHPVHHMGAGLLQAGGEADIGLLVETCPQLDHHGDLLARQGRATRASTMADSGPVRYRVCLMVSTCGSVAAWRMKSMTGAKDSKG